MIVGGWEYVFAAYGVAWTGLLVYGVTLHARLRLAHESVAKERQR